jgi:alpha-tubulin suppressor-like RCC1 family protein
MGSKLAIPNGSLIDLDRPTPIDWFRETGLRWEQIMTGPYFGSAVSGDGKVFVWGYNSAESKFVPPKRVFDSEGSRIAVSEDKVFVLTRKGAVVVIDPLTGEEETTLMIPSESFFGVSRVKFVSISAGRSHVLLLDNKGRVWTCGDNEYGQCARPLTKSQKNINRFNYVEKPKSEKKSKSHFTELSCVYSEPDVATAVHCGGLHSAFLTKSGKCLSFGDDSKIQLGLGDTRSQDAPDYVPHSGMGRLDPDGLAPDMSKMFQQFSPAVKYTFYDRHFRNKPTDMKVSQNVNSVVLGDNFSLVQVGSEGQMLCCGENRSGQCGRGLNKQQQTFSSIKLPRQQKPVQVSCGLSHCIASLDDGSVHVWGDNSHGQLGVGSRASQCPPVVLHRSKLRGVLIQDVITKIGKGDASAEEIEEFLSERQQDRPLSLDNALKIPEVSQQKPESKLKKQLLAAIEQGKEKLIMSELEQTKFVPVLVSASFNNSILVLQDQ